MDPYHKKMDWTWGPTPDARQGEEEKSEEAQINTRISDLLPPYMYKNKHLVSRLAIYEQRKQHELKQLQESVEYQFIAQVAAFTNENLDNYWQENFNSMIDNNTQTERTISTFDIENARREAHVLADADVHRWCICADALVVRGDIHNTDTGGTTLFVDREKQFNTPAQNKYNKVEPQDHIHPPSVVKSARMRVRKEYDAQNNNVIRFQDVSNAQRLQFFLANISETSRAMLYPHLNFLFHVKKGWKRDMQELRLVLNTNLVDREGEAEELALHTLAKEINQHTPRTSPNLDDPDDPYFASPSDRNRGDHTLVDVEPAVDKYKYTAPTAAAIQQAVHQLRTYATRAAARRAPGNQDNHGDTDAETYLEVERLHTYIPEVRSYYAQRCHHWFHQIIKSNYDSRPLLAADKWYNKTTWARLHHYYAPVLYGHMREIASVLKNTHPQLKLRDATMEQALPWLIGKNGDADSDQRSFLFAKCVALAIRGSQVLSGKRYGLNSTFVRIKSLRRLAMHAWKSVKQGYK